MKYITMSLMAAAALVLTSCGAPRVGVLYTDITMPVAAGNGSGNRIGTSKSTTYFGLIALGDASVEAAKRNGRISSVNTVDVQVKSTLGVVTTYVTTVRGN